MPSDRHDNGNAQVPLAGVVLCCTSIAPEQRSILANAACQMGADHRFDLMSDVTHLVVGHVDTPKYNYVAKERTDVKVVLPSFIDAVRESWMRGGTTDVAALEQEHGAPALLGLRICVTGFDDLEQRRYIQTKVQEHGAEYHGDLTKAVTHLIAAVARGKKYEYGRQWGVKVVSLAWLTDSLERGMVLEESLYDPILPSGEQGKGAWNRVPLQNVMLGKRTRDSEQPSQGPVDNRRKLRRTLSSKLTSQNQDIWANITGFGPADDALALAEVAKKQENVSQLRQPPTGNKIGILGGLSGQALFQSRIVFIHGFDAKKSTVLKSHLASNGASTVIDTTSLDFLDSEQLAKGFVIVPHDQPFRASDLPQPARALTKVTEWWVESCLYRNTLIDPVENVILQPFKRLGIAGFENMIVCSTAFPAVDLLHVSKVVPLMGGTYDEFLKPTTSVLVCNVSNPKAEKLKYAAEHNIPAVGAEWLWDCLREGKNLPFEIYLVHRNAEEGEKVEPHAQVHKASGTDRYSEGFSGRSKRCALGSFNPKTMKKPTKPGTSVPPSPRRRMLPVQAVRSRSGISNSTLSNSGAVSTGYDGSASQPLQELPAEVNSSRKRSQSQDAEDDSLTLNASATKYDPASIDAETIPPPSNENLNHEIALLLAKRQASRPGPAADKEAPRKRRLLGRALSVNSNRSTSHLSSLEGNTAALESAAESAESRKIEAAEYQPSQALVYEDASVQLERERLMRIVGGVLEGQSTRVEGVGFVRDDNARAERSRRGKRSGRA